MECYTYGSARDWHASAVLPSWGASVTRASPWWQGRKTYHSLRPQCVRPAEASVHLPYYITAAVCKTC